MKLVTVQCSTWMPNNVHEMEFKNNVIRAMDYLGIIVQDVRLVMPEFTPESKKTGIVPKRNRKVSKKVKL